MCFLLCLEVSVGWNRREEQAADELKRINHVNGWSFLLCFHLLQGSWFMVQGSGVRWRLRRLFLLGRCPEVAFKSPVIPLISGEWIVSHVWHEILRLSPHLFWLGLFHT